MSGDNDEVVKKDEDAAEAESKSEAPKEEPKSDEAAEAAKSDEADAPKEEAKAEAAKDDEEAPKDDEKAEEAESPKDEEPESPKDEEAESPKDEEPAHAAHAHGDHADHGEPMVEDDRPKNGIIGVTIVTTLAAVIFSVLGVNEIYHATFNSEVQEKVLGRTSSELRELRAEEKGKLGRYQWVSKKDGVVRIPVDRAIELTIAEYRERAKKAAEAPKPAAPAPEGTAAPDAPKPDGSAAPDAPKVPATAAPNAPAPEAPKPKEH